MNSNENSNDLTAIFEQILHMELDPAQVASFLLGLRQHDVDPKVLYSLARVLRENCRGLKCNVRPLIDTCGTGGDGAGTFNISTAAAFVVAAAGGAVAKHGNRSVSSKTGSADLVEALGFPLDLPAERCGTMLDSTGFAFLFAPTFHPLMKNVQAIRRKLKVPTIFNLAGPLANPAIADYQVLGVSSPELTLPMAETLRLLGVRGALVIHCEGIDEFGLHAPTVGHRVDRDELSPFSFDPQSIGIAPASIADLAGGSSATNAAISIRMFQGEIGPMTDAVALNAGAALYIAGLASSIEEGFLRASELLGNGAVLRVLERSLESANRLREEVVA